MRPADVLSCRSRLNFPCWLVNLRFHRQPAVLRTVQGSITSIVCPGSALLQIELRVYTRANCLYPPSARGCGIWEAR